VWLEMVVLHREALEAGRKARANYLNKPSKLFFGSSSNGREFMMKSLGAEQGLRFHRY